MALIKCEECGKDGDKKSDDEAKNYEEIFKDCCTQESKPQNKKRLILIIVIILLILSFSSPFIIKNIKLFSLKNELKLSVEKNTIQKYKYCNNIMFEGNYNDIVKVTMNETFDELNYEEKEKIIVEINSNINDEFNTYITKRSKIEENITTENRICKIAIYVNNDCYKYNHISKTITKNDEKYNILTDLKEQIAIKIKDDSYNSYLDNITDSDSLKNIISLENIDECKKEIIYLSAIKLYEDGYFENAMNEFNKIEGEYKEKNNYIKNSEILNSIQGTYRASYIKLIVINKWNITFGIDPQYNTISNLSECSFSYRIENDELILTRERTIQEIGRGICERYKINIANKSIAGNEYDTYYYESNNLNFPERLKEPKIGMTASEVENSTWGKPNKKNKDTYSWGTKEQWVYSGYKYIYFENGIVTSISE